MGTVDEQSGQTSLGPSTGDVMWALAIHAITTAVPNGAERSKLEGMRSRSISGRLDAVIDAVLARS